MTFPRLLYLAPLPMLASCSAIIQESGRDPMKLVGRSQASIHGEFGKPLKTQQLPGYYDTAECFHVTGSWENELGTMNYTLGTLYTFGVLEPALLVSSAVSKSRDKAQGVHLVVGYHNGIVARASARSIDRGSPVNEATLLHP